MLPIRGGEYYVAPDGSDSNPGTLTSPFQTIQKAVYLIFIYLPSYSMICLTLTRSVAVSDATVYLRAVSLILYFFV